MRLFGGVLQCCTVACGVKPPPLPAKEVLHLQVDRGDYLLEGAPGEALQQHAPVVTLFYAEAGIPIIVSRTDGHEVAVMRLDPLQALQGALDGLHPDAPRCARGMVLVQSHQILPAPWLVDCKSEAGGLSLASCPGIVTQQFRRNQAPRVGKS